MKMYLYAWFACVMLISSAGAAFSQQPPKGEGSHRPKVHPEVWKKAQEKGVVNVVVTLNMAWQREGNLSKDKIPAQRKAIAEAQKKLLAELAGTDYKLESLAPISPRMSLVVNPNALTILENSTLVLRVSENIGLKRHLLRSVSFVGVGQGSMGNFDGTGFGVAR